MHHLILSNIMQVFAVSGYSGSGKTTVVEKIVSTLTKRGHSVITVKSSAHDVDEERGTDTWRHRHAGAQETIMLGPKSTVVHYGERRTLNTLIQEEDADYLIIEGMKSSDIPKIWCVGPLGLEEEQLPSSVKAVVVWEKSEKMQHDSIPIIEANDVDGILAIIDQEGIDFATLNL